MRTGGQMPDQARGWRIDLPDGDSAQLTNTNGQVIYDGECPQPGDWLEVVSEVGGCVVLIGTAGLYAVADDDMTTGRFSQMLNQAARAGTLVGGLVDT
jgi:hypothetical protein